MSRFAAISRRLAHGQLTLSLNQELAKDAVITIGRLFVPSPAIKCDGHTEIVFYLDAPAGFINTKGEPTGAGNAIAELGHLGLMIRFAHTSKTPRANDWHWFGFYEPAPDKGGLKRWHPCILGGPDIGNTPVGPHAFPPPNCSDDLDEGQRARFTLSLPTNRRRWLQLVWSPEIRRSAPGTVTARLTYHIEGHTAGSFPSVSPVHTVLQVEIEPPALPGRGNGGLRSV